jgi:transposase InsO family protein
MEQRIEFVIRACQGREKLSTLCREYGVSRPTGYLWVNRYRAAGSINGLAELSRRPRRTPTRTPEGIEARVVALRDRWGWGAKKLAVLLKREGITLAVRTIHRILKRYERVRKEASFSPALRRFERAQPNELWQCDFKGEYGTDSGFCYPFSLLDDHSRYAVGLFALPATSGERVWSCFQRTFERYGVPEAVLCDHGSPWWSTHSEHGLTQVSVALIKQGVRLHYSGVGHPQTQGKVERFHRTLKDAIRHQGQPQGFREWSSLLALIRHEYNHVRPHEALAMMTPAQRYQPSPRPYLPHPPEWVYPEGAQVAQINSAGNMNWRGAQYFVSHALEGERVQVQEVGETLIVNYRHMYIREISTLTGRSTAVLLPVSPA